MPDPALFLPDGRLGQILAINPGSTSTKVGIFHGEELVFVTEIRHTAEELRPFPLISDQIEFRFEVISQALTQAPLDLSALLAVVGRGGFTRPIPSGVYRVDNVLVSELLGAVHGNHASNLGAPLAQEFALKAGTPAYIVDPIAVDELDPVARVTGIPQIRRRSIFHALNQKRMARRAAGELGKPYEEVNLIVVHLGGGITVAAHRRGRVVEVNNAVEGEGPFAPERSGGLPAAQVAEMSFSGQYTLAEIHKLINGRGGLVAYFGTNESRSVEEAAASGDESSKLLLDAMIYNVAREIGACAAVLEGNVDAVVLTGGMAKSRWITEELRRKVQFIAPLLIYPGEDEMRAMFEGVLRVLRGEVVPMNYGEVPPVV